MFKIKKYVINKSSKMPGRKLNVLENVLRHKEITLCLCIHSTNSLYKGWRTFDLWVTG